MEMEARTGDVLELGDLLLSDKAQRRPWILQFGGQAVLVPTALSLRKGERKVMKASKATRSAGLVP